MTIIHWINTDLIGFCAAVWGASFVLACFITVVQAAILSQNKRGGVVS